MEVSLEAYRAAIGLFNYFRIRCFKFVYSLNRADTALILLSIALCIVLRIVLSNDVELNPGPFLKFGHLNVRSLNRDDKFDEISELVKENGFDVFAVTETWLNDRVSSVVETEKFQSFRVKTPFSNLSCVVWTWRTKKKTSQVLRNFITPDF